MAPPTRMCPLQQVRQWLVVGIMRALRLAGAEQYCCRGDFKLRTRPRSVFALVCMMQIMLT